MEKKLYLINFISLVELKLKKRPIFIVKIRVKRRTLKLWKYTKEAYFLDPWHTLLNTHVMTQSTLPRRQSKTDSASFNVLGLIGWISSQGTVSEPKFVHTIIEPCWKCWTRHEWNMNFRENVLRNVVTEIGCGTLRLWNSVVGVRFSHKAITADSYTHLTLPTKRIV